MEFWVFPVGRFHAQGASRNWVIDERDGSDSSENRAHRIYQLIATNRLLQLLQSSYIVL
jgi:hypothetical protein